MKRSSALTKAISKKKKVVGATGVKKRKAFDESHSHHRKPKKPRAKGGMNAAEQDEQDLRYLERVLGIRRGKPLPRDFREDGDELYDLLESLRSDSEESGDDEDSTKDPLYCPPTDDPLPPGVQKELEAEMKEDGGDLVITDDMLARARAAPALSAGTSSDHAKPDSDDDTTVPDEKDDEEDEEEEKEEETHFDEEMEEAERRKQRAEEREEVLRTTEGKAVLRVVKGAVNKLCEANLEPIFNQVEALRLQYSQPVVNEAVGKCVVESCVLSGGRSGATAQIVVDCALVALLNAVVGAEVGGLVLERVAARYMDARAAGADALPVATTMAVVLAHLYNFDVVSCTLVYDLVRRLVAAFGPADIEVLLALLRQAGPQLRHDDPSALKDIVLAVQAQAHKATAGGAAAAAGTGKDDDDGEESGFSARVQFMLDTIYELKNNRQAETPELLLVQRLRKTAHRVAEKRGTTLSANEIRTTWDDLTAADPQGRWWAVGSAFAQIDIAPGRAGAGTAAAGAGAARPQGERRLLQSAGVALDEQMMALAKKHRMNTDAKRAVFAIIVSGEDYIDTFQKLMKLGLKGSAQRDIPGVLLYLCGREKHYNAYYEHVAQQLCSLGHNMCFTFQTTFWDTFKPFSAAQSAPPTLAQGREASNVAQLLAALVAAGFLSLLCLKTVPFEALNATGVLFFRVFFTHLLTDSDEGTVERVFQRLAASHGTAAGERRSADADVTVIKLKEGISLFFLQAFGSITIYKSEDDSEKRAKKLLKQRVALANGILVDSVSADMF